MNLELYVENLNRQLAVAAEAGGDEARALAERLVAPLEAAIGPAAPARTRPRVRGDTTAGRPVRRRPGRGPRRPASRLPRGRRGHDVADQPPYARPPQGPDRAGGRERGAVGQRLARAGGRRRPGTNRPVPSTRTARLPGRPALHGLGTLANPQRNCRCLPSILPNRSPSPSSSASVTSGSWPATAPTPWSRCARATPPRRPT